MHPDGAKLLWDALQAAQRAARFVSGKTWADYESDELLRPAVERQFEIMGEALSRLSKVDPATALQVDDLPRVVAFRNLLIHGYASVDHKIVWGVLQGSLPALQTTLHDLLARHRPGG